MVKYYINMVMVLTYGFYSYTHEFLYPVAAYKNEVGQDKVLVLYQKSLAHLELWSWDPITQVATKALLSTFAPAGLRLLPDARGFSFIDNGRIRIKEFIKRSPKSIEFNDPITNVGPVIWSDFGTGYFSGQERGLYSIFSLTPTDDIARCAAQKVTDCLYPYPCGTALFYIERTHAAKEQVPFTPEAEQQSTAYMYSIVKQSVDLPVEGNRKEVIADFGERPIVYVTMFSESEGFVLEHAPLISKYETTIVFLCHHVVRISERWQTVFLFSFSVPADLLLPSQPSRLYESLLPLLPRYYSGSLYYVDTDKDCLVPYKYVINTAQKYRCLPNILLPGYTFTPLLCCNSILLYGGSIGKQEPAEYGTGIPGPQMYFDTTGSLIFTFPSEPMP